MLLVMSSLPDRSSEQKRGSFVILLVVLVVVAITVAFVISSSGDDEVGGASTPSSGVSASAGAVTLQTACAEIAPDMALRVDALTRTAEAVRADIATMRGEGNLVDAEQATQVAVALENLAGAEKDQQGVSRATRELGHTLSSNC
jgi:hypothetical protein